MGCVMVTSTKQSQHHVEIPSGRRRLSGILHVPPGATGVIAFAHGSGSGRFSPRNQFAARVLQESRLATLLLDLLEEEEAPDRKKVFDIELLADRLESAATWLSGEPATRGPAARLFRSEYRGGGGPRGRGSESPSGQSLGFPRRPPRPGQHVPVRRPSADAVDCRRQRRRGD